MQLFSTNRTYCDLRQILLLGWAFLSSTCPRICPRPFGGTRRARRTTSHSGKLFWEGACFSISTISHVSGIECYSLNFSWGSLNAELWLGPYFYHRFHLRRFYLNQVHYFPVSNLNFAVALSYPASVLYLFRSI